MRGDTDAALAAFESAAASGDAEFTAIAEAWLGQLLTALDRREDAADAWARAVDAIPDDDADAIGGAVAGLAWLLLHHRELLPRVLRNASERAVAHAVGATVAVLEQLGAIDEARRICELAIDSGRTQPARSGAHMLGRLLRADEDIARARAAVAQVGQHGP